MIITATDFQLRVNEYFTRLVQGEEIIIERYGKKFAVLKPYTEDKSSAEQPVQSIKLIKEELGVESFTKLELVKIVKTLLRQITD